MRLLRALLRDCAGSMVVETAIVTPVLALMSLGAFQVSAIVARQQELQSGASEAVAIALAAPPVTAEQRTTLKGIVQTSLGLKADQVTVTTTYRCGTASSYVTSSQSCSDGVLVSTYVRIAVSDTYVPKWTKLGVGQPIRFSVVRTVQIS